jgi:hypothetical protein
VSESSSASVRADILQKYPELFGTKTIDGRKVNGEDLVAKLTRDTRDEFAALMKARHELRAHDYVYDVFESAEGVAA